MTKEEAIKQLRLGPGINEDVSEEYNDAVDMAIKALEIVEEFEKAQIITGGRLNGRAFAYKCGLAEGKRKALEQQPIEDCVRRQAVIEIINKSDACLYEKSDNNGLVEEIKTGI